MSCSSDDDQPAISDIIISDQFKNDASGWQIVGDAQGGYVEASTLQMAAWSMAIFSPRMM